MAIPTPDSPALVLLAAGLGTRYGALKQLDAVGPCGEVLMEYTLADARRAGFGPVIIVVRREIEEAMSERFDCVPHGMDVTFVRQETDDLPHMNNEGRQRPLGTAHAVWSVRDSVSGPFAVANADDYYGPDAFRALAGHFAEGAADRPWAVAGYRLADVLSDHGGVNRGLLEVSPDGTLNDVVELKGLRGEGAGVHGRDSTGTPIRLGGEELISMNLWGFESNVMSHLDAGLARFVRDRGRDPNAEYLLPGAVRDAITLGVARVRVVPGGSEVFGMTHPEDRPVVVGRLAERGSPWGESTCS